MFSIWLFSGVWSLIANVSEYPGCSETLAMKLHSLENNPKENIRKAMQLLIYLFTCLSWCPVKGQYKYNKQTNKQTKSDWTKVCIIIKSSNEDGCNNTEHSNRNIIQEIWAVIATAFDAILHSAYKYASFAWNSITSSDTYATPPPPTPRKLKEVQVNATQFQKNNTKQQSRK
jgi:hypothetical protein